MILNKKGILKDFDLVIYPVTFVVAIGDMEKEINKRYAPYDSNYNYIGPHKNAGGTTYVVKEKDTNNFSVLIWIYDIEYFKSSIVSHECGHAAMEIFNYIGARFTYDDQEPFCYLLGNLARLLVGAYYEWKDYKPEKLERKSEKSKKNGV